MGLRSDNRVEGLSDHSETKIIVLEQAGMLEIYMKGFFLSPPVFHLQACRQFLLLGVAGYFDAEYPGRFVYHTPLVSVDRRQSFDLFDLNEKNPIRKQNKFFKNPTSLRVFKV